MTPAIDRFDTWADTKLEVLRGRAVPDAMFQFASKVGDFSAVWHVAGLARVVVGGRPVREALALSGLLGAESLVVNQGVKRIFRRARPTESGDPRFPQRRPSTSSFPSGHASSAAFAATILTHWDHGLMVPVWIAIAAIVGTSRAYVRIHHASDVLAGAALGTALGLAGRVVAAHLGA